MLMPKAELRKFAVKLGPYFFSFLFFLLVMKSPYNLKYTWQISLFEGMFLYSSWLFPLTCDGTNYC